MILCQMDGCCNRSYLLTSSQPGFTDLVETGCRGMRMAGGLIFKLLSSKYVWITVAMIAVTLISVHLLAKPVGCHLDQKFVLVQEGIAKAKVFELMTDVRVPVYQHDESVVENGQLKLQSDYIWDDGVHHFKIVVSPAGLVQSKCLGESNRVTWFGEVLDKIGW